VIERREEGHVTILRLDHGKASTLDLELLEATEAELARAERDSAAVVLTGTGAIFSAGVDLFRLLDGGEGYLARFLPALVRACERLVSFPRPLVAAINGHALAGGWVFACACDYRVMASGTGRLGVPELQVGVAFPPIALETVRQRTPRHLLDAMVFAGRTFTAEEAERERLVEEVVPPGVLLARAVQVAESMGRIPAEAYRLTKLQVRRPTLERAAAGAPTGAAVDAQWASPEATQAIRAYLERVVGKGGGSAAKGGG
jgi:enoyl-CoA hydratase